MQHNNTSFQTPTVSVFTVDEEREMFHFSVSVRNAAHCAEKEDEIWMKGGRGEETRTDIIWRTVGLPTLIPRD